MDAIDQVIALGDKLKAARDLAARSDSLEQACRESEGRLASLRDQESRAQANLTAAYDEAKRVAAAAEAGARTMLADAEAQYKKRLADCQRVCDEAVQVNKEAVARLEDEQEGAFARLKLLEAEESTLGQSVAALRAELAAIRSRLG